MCNDPQGLLTHTSVPQQFLRATAATAVARLSHRNSVCLSVRPSHGWISQKRYKSSPSAARKTL